MLRAAVVRGEGKQPERLSAAVCRGMSVYPCAPGLGIGTEIHLKEADGRAAVLLWGPGLGGLFLMPSHPRPTAVPGPASPGAQTFAGPLGRMFIIQRRGTLPADVHMGTAFWLSMKPYELYVRVSAWT